jgi:hypothetical protein
MKRKLLSLYIFSRTYNSSDEIKKEKENNFEQSEHSFEKVAVSLTTSKSILST